MQSLYAIISCFYRKYIKRFFYKKPHHTILSTHIAHNFIPSKKCALISHYDPDGVFDTVFIRFVYALKELGFDIYIITTSKKLEKKSFDSLSKISDVIIHRKNVGLDFASWASAIIKFKIFKRYNSVLLTNDSIVGPIHNLSPFIDYFENSHGLGGFTESSIIIPHLQSYFLYLNKELVDKKYIQRFFDKILILKDKKDIILFYEIGLSQTILSNGDKINPIIPINKSYSLVEPRLQNKNFSPTTHAWYPIIKKYNFPFIKRVVLTDPSKLNLYSPSIEQIDIIKDESLKEDIIRYIRRFIKK